MPALVVGLGNPGAEYEGTRHNVGFAVLDRMASALGRSFLRRGRSAVARGEVGDRSVLLAKPTTYMNRSGRAVRDLMADLPARTDLLVVCDDLALPLGRLRFRAKGSSGGQKGLGSILELLGRTEVPRLRLGIGDPGRQAAEEYVLRPFRRGEQEAAGAMIEAACGHLLDWLEHGSLERLSQAVHAPG